MDNNWKQDPRLMAMDPEKSKLINGICRKKTHTDQSPAHASFSAYMPEANAKRSAIYKF